MKALHGIFAISAINLSHFMPSQKIQLKQLRLI
jgi:hypothetical protein